MKKYLFILLTPFLLMALSCEEESPIAPYQAFFGAQLAVDGDGHFTEDVVYTEEQSTKTWNMDGSFEMIYYAYDSSGNDYDNDGVVDNDWVQEGGRRGTYSYDPASYTLTYHQTSGYGPARDSNGNEISGGGMVWMDDNDTNTETELILFTDHVMRGLYKKSSEGVWVSTQTTRWESTEADAAATDYYTNTQTETITITDTTYSYYLIRKGERPYSEFYTAPLNEWERSRKGTLVDSFHETVGTITARTYLVRMTEDTEKHWNFNHDDGSNNLEQDDDYMHEGKTRTYTYLEFGDYLVGSWMGWQRTIK